MFRKAQEPALLGRSMASQQQLTEDNAEPKGNQPMKENPMDEGRFSVRGQGLGTVTEEMVRQRAAELAIINGRSKHNILDSDLTEARRELTGKERLDPLTEAADEIPESERWDPVPGSSGSAAPTVPASDEQTFAEKLVEEGIEDAEQDQMLESARESLKRERQS